MIKRDNKRLVKLKVRWQYNVIHTTTLRELTSAFEFGMIVGDRTKTNIVGRCGRRKSSAIAPNHD